MLVRCGYYNPDSTTARPDGMISEAMRADLGDAALSGKDACVDGDLVES
jgi:hypothetical protein